MEHVSAVVHGENGARIFFPKLTIQEINVMRGHSEKYPSENHGSRRADRMPDQGGRRSQEAEKTRRAHETGPRPQEAKTVKQK